MSEQQRGITPQVFIGILSIPVLPKERRITSKNRINLKVVNTSSAVQSLCFTRHTVSRYANPCAGFIQLNHPSVSEGAAWCPDQSLKGLSQHFSWSHYILPQS